MTAERTQFRTTLQDLLTIAYGYKFVGGPIDLPQRERDLGCVWWEGKRPFARDGNMEENYYRVRVLRQFKVEEAAAALTLPSLPGLEDAAEQLEAALVAVLTTAGHDFFTVVEVTADYPRQWVEAQLVAYDRNRSAAGG